MSGLARWLTGYLINSAWQIPVLAVCTAGLVKIAARGGARLQYRLWVSCLVLAIAVPALPAMRMPSFDWGRSGVGSAEAKGGGVVPAMNAGERIAIYTDAIVEPVRQGSGGRVLLWVYGLSVLVGVGRLGRKLWVTRAVMQGASRMVLPPARDAVLARLMEAFGIGEVAVYSSSRLRCPATVSWPGAVLLVPEDFASVAEEEAVAAISHELAHVRRRDFAVNLGCEVVAVFGFYHPVTHWVMRRIAEAREVVVDEMAAEATTGATAYAKALLSLAEGVATRAEAGNLLLGVLESGGLEKRIMRLIDVPLPLSRQYRVISAFCCLVGLTVAGVGIAMLGVRPSVAQSADAIKLPAFEVVSVKENVTGSGGFPHWFVPDGLNLENVPVTQIIQAANGFWGIADFDKDRIIGVPGWAKSARYDVRAKVADTDVNELGKLSQDHRMLMLRPILEDRFQLKTHIEKREMQVYALVRAKNGPKLKDAIPGYNYPNKLGGGGTGANRLGVSGGRVTAQGIQLNVLANYLTTVLHQTVVDETGFTGSYDFKLNYSPDDANPQTQAGSNSPDPSLFTAVGEQLGLKLELKREPVEFLVVDHIERPSQN